MRLRRKTAAILDHTGKRAQLRCTAVTCTPRLCDSSVAASTMPIAIESSCIIDRAILYLKARTRTRQLKPHSRAASHFASWPINSPYGNCSSVTNVSGHRRLPGRDGDSSPTKTPAAPNRQITFCSAPDIFRQPPRPDLCTIVNRRTRSDRSSFSGTYSRPTALDSCGAASTLSCRNPESIWIFRFVGHVVSLVAVGGTGSQAESLKSLRFHSRSTAWACARRRALFRSASHAADRILHIFLSCGIVGLHTELFAIIHDRRSPQSQVQPGHDFAIVVVLVRRHSDRRIAECRDC